MKKREVTIYDIAQALQVSPATVSRALKNHAGIGKETIKQVQDLAEQLGYQPNIIASSLRNSKTNTIGILVPLINRPFVAAVLSGMEPIAHKAGYQILIAQTHDSARMEAAQARTMFASRVAGLLVSLAMETTDYRHFDSFRRKDIPLIFFDRGCPEQESSKIIIDDFKAAFEATEHLIGQGCRRIAHLAGSQNRENYRNRLQGYLAALQKYDLPQTEELILYSYLSRETGWEAAKLLLNLPQPPDGIFSANDTAAVSVIQVLKERNVRVPDEVAVVGFNDDPIATIIEPALTTIVYPAQEMGKLAIEQFLKLKAHPESSVQDETILLKTSLIVRASSRRKG